MRESDSCRERGCGSRDVDSDVGDDGEGDDEGEECEGGEIGWEGQDGTHYRFVMQIVEQPGYIFDPLQTAKHYVLYATLSAFGIVFIPLAIFTTLHLWRRIINAPVVQAWDPFLLM